MRSRMHLALNNADGRRKHYNNKTSLARFLDEHYLSLNSIACSNFIAASRQIPTPRLKMSLPSKLPNEADLKDRLQYSKKRVVELQKAVAAINHAIGRAAGLLRAELALIAERSLAMKVCVLDQVRALNNPSTIRLVVTRMHRIRVYCILLQWSAGSILDAGKLPGMIAAIEFEIFTPPHGISNWEHWTSHRQQTKTEDLKDLEEAVEWWESTCHRWATIWSASRVMQASLEKDFNHVHAINMAFDAVHHGIEVRAPARLMTARY